MDVVIFSQIFHLCTVHSFYFRVFSFLVKRKTTTNLKTYALVPIIILFFNMEIHKFSVSEMTGASRFKLKNIWPDQKNPFLLTFCLSFEMTKREWAFWEYNVIRFILFVWDLPLGSHKSTFFSLKKICFGAIYIFLLWNIPWHAYSLHGSQTAWLNIHCLYSWT